MARRLQAGEVSRVEDHPTIPGALRVRLRASRTGVKEYRDPQGRVRRERLGVDELRALLPRLKDVPITVGHPSDGGLVTADSWHALAKGHVAEVEPELEVIDGEHWAHVWADVQDGETVRRLRSKDLVETSLCRAVDPAQSGGPGPGWDLSQPAGVPNHIALLGANKARAGAHSRVLLDSLDADEGTPKMEVDVFLSKLEALQSENAQLKAQLATAQAASVISDARQSEVAELSAQVATLTAERDTARAVDVHALVQDELGFRAGMVASLPGGYDFAGKARIDVCKDAIRHLGGTVVADSTDVYLRGQLAGLQVAAKTPTTRIVPDAKDLPKTPDQIRAEKRAQASK